MLTPIKSVVRVKTLSHHNAMRCANSATSRLDKDYLTSVKQVGMDVVEGLDLGHGGVEALGDKPE